MGSDHNSANAPKPTGGADPGDPARVCIYGVYGKGNLGDEALLAAIREDLRSIRPDVRLTAFCSSPKDVTRCHGIDAVCRKPWREFARKLRAIQGADLFVIGGGTLLRDARRRRDEIAVVGSVVFWPLVAKLAGVPVVALGSGVGAARHALMRAGIKHFFSNVDEVAFRDAASASLFARLSGRADSLVTCDPVVSSSLFDPDEVALEANADVKAVRRRNAPYVVLAIRRSEWVSLEESMDYFRACARAVAALQRETDVSVVLFPAQVSAEFPDDNEPAEILASLLEQEGVPEGRLVKQTWSRLADGCAILQGADLVVSDRLHALLIAAKAGVACVATSTAEKIAGCLEMIGTCAALAAVDAATEGAEPLLEVLRAAWRERLAARAAIVEGVRRWGNAAPNKALLRRYLEPERAPTPQPRGTGQEKGL